MHSATDTTDFADNETNTYQENNLPVPVSYVLVLFLKSKHIHAAWIFIIFC